MGSMDVDANEVSGGAYIPQNGVDITPKKDGGVLKEIKKEGTGSITPPNGCKVIVHYEGKLTDGTVFDSSRDRSPFEFNLGKGNVIKAWDIGVATMKKGEVAYLVCREDYAYGSAGSPPKIPPKATLIFEVEVIDWEPENLSGKKDRGILRTPITEGVGFDSPKETAHVQIHIKGEFEGRIFDERDVSFCLGEGSEEDVPPGVEKALEKFIKKETSRLDLKPQYGLGLAGKKFDLPPDAALTYTVTLNDFDHVEDSWMMSSSKKIEESKRLKEKGTNYFKAGKYQLALKMYNRIVDLLGYKSSFEGVEKAEAESLELAANLNISICYLKMENFTSARNACDKILAEDKSNVKALFRRGSAYLGLGEPQLAKQDFDAVLNLEPDNKAVQAQIAVCNAKLKEFKSKEKKMYVNMFEKFAQKDREKEEEERKKQPDIMKGCFGEWGAEEREREPTDFEKENPDILMLEGTGDFKNM